MNVDATATGPGHTSPIGPATRLWRWSLLAVVALFALLDLWAYSNWQRALDPAVAGTLGVTHDAPDAGNRLPITSLEPGSPLVAAGARVGDSLVYDHVGSQPGRRPLGTDESIGLTLYGEGPARHLAVTPMANPAFRLDSALIIWFAGNGGRAIGLLVVLMLALRRAESPPMRALALALLFQHVLGLYFLPGGIVHDLATSGALLPFWFASSLCYLYFALHEPAARPPIQRLLVRGLYWTYALALAPYIALAMVETYTAGNGRLPHLRLPQGVHGAFFIVNQLVQYSAALALGLAWRASSGGAGQRLAWLFWATGGLYIVTAAGVVLAVSGVWPAFNRWQFAAFDLVLLASFSALAYAVLRHRVFQFGVVVQRALAFSIVSALLLAALGAGKWGVDKLLHATGQQHSALWEVGVAMALVVAFARMQDWIISRVNEIFFRGWQQAGQALRHAVDKAAHITEPALLQKRIVVAVDAYSGATGTALYDLDAESSDGGLLLRQGTLPAAPPRLAVDDELLVELRHAARPVELQRLAPGACAASGLAEWAFPMIVRGGVSGVLLLGPKRNGLAYRSDELELLAASAQRVGLDLESLRVAALERQRQALLAENAELRAALAARSD